MVDRKGGSLFIAFEGLDGSGKTEQIWRLYHSQKIEPIRDDIRVYSEPGGTYIGERIRGILLEKIEDSSDGEMSDIAELLLYSASRAQLVELEIIPSLRDGKIVICDRYAHSTIAYQGHGLGMSMSQICDLQEFVTRGVWPDLVIYLDIDPQTGMDRKSENRDRIESRDIEFFDRVRGGYLDMAHDDKERWVTIDASDSIDSVHQNILRIVEKRLS